MMYDLTVGSVLLADVTDFLHTKFAASVTVGINIGQLVEASGRQAGVNAENEFNLGEVTADNRKMIRNE